MGSDFQVRLNRTGEALPISPAALALADPGKGGLMDATNWRYLAAILQEAAPRWQPGDFIIEVGTYVGSTAAFMARVLAVAGISAPVLCIDAFERVARSFGNPAGSYAGFRATVDNAKLANQCLALSAFSKDAAPLIAHRARLLVIDGGHQYETTKDDLEIYAPKVLDGGWLFIHDTGWHPVYAGVEKAFDEFLGAHPEFVLAHRETFSICRRREDRADPPLPPSPPRGRFFLRGRGAEASPRLCRAFCSHGTQNSNNRYPFPPTGRMTTLTTILSEAKAAGRRAAEREGGRGTA